MASQTRYFITMRLLRPRSWIHKRDLDPRDQSSRQGFQYIGTKSNVSGRGTCPVSRSGSILLDPVYACHRT